MSSPSNVLHYDRAGRPITAERWSALCGDPDYHAVCQEMVGSLWISTVWLGLDHSFGLGGPPLIFETMVFATDSADPWLDLECERYATETQAHLGHDRMVARARAGELAPEPDNEITQGVEQMEPKR